ncbi:MAG: choice-of-anchor J domain-containing protein [Duncaniella sp.]|nr:choice-of-anchor J domain-containing protein [Duncaniella sp.]
MKKNLIRFFSLALAAVTAMGVSADPLAMKSSVKSPLQGVAVRTMPAETNALKGIPARPVLHQGAKPNVFSSPVIRPAALNVKAPLKVGAKAESTGRMPQLLGTVGNFSGYGLYSIPTSADMTFERLFKYAFGEYGAVLIGDVYYACEYYNSPFGGASTGFIGYDITNGNTVFEAYTTFYTYSMTIDETTSTIYGIANMGNYFTLAKINIDTENSSVTMDAIERLYINELGMWNALACDKDGQLYGLLTLLDEEAAANDQFVCTGTAFYKIDKETAVATRIGETGFDSTYASDATFDTKTNRLFWTVYDVNQNGYLTEIDTTTGAASVIYQFPDHETYGYPADVTGLVVLPPSSEDDAPAEVTDLTANFTGASLSGTIDFKAPATHFDGSAASGAITYTVKANNEVVSTGSTTFGATVAAPVTVPAAGFYTFTVYASNEKGDGPKAETTSYVGADTPEATTATLSYADGKMTVTWLPVTTSINGGYIDVDGITYTVTRYPDEVVTKDIKGTTFSETVPEPDGVVSYYYTVVVNAGELSSQPARTNVINLGSVTPPFTATFDNDNDLDGFSVIDANGDGTTWRSFDGHARINFNKTEDMDDWMISPGLKLEAGKLYDIAADFSCGNVSYPERVEVKIGTAPTVEGMTTTLLEPTEIAVKIEAPYEWNTIFIPETDGTYYVGIHGISDKNTFILNADNFSVSAPKIAEVPAAINDLTVTPGANGALTAEIAFTTPGTTLSGKELEGIGKVELLRNNEVIKTWEAPAINTALTYTDNLSKAAEYTYKVIAYNLGGSSPETSVSLFIGIDFPARVTGIYGHQTENPGEVTISWSAVTTTQSGLPIDPSMVRYQVFRYVDNSFVNVSDLLETTSFTYQAVPNGKQEFVMYVVYARTERGFGDYGASNQFPAGTPYKGVTYTADNDFYTYLLSVNSSGGGDWDVYDDNMLPAQDGDDRLLGMFGRYVDTSASLSTGLITLEGMENPGISLFTYNIGLTDDNGQPEQNANEIIIGVKTPDQTEYTTVKTVVVGETGPANSWNRIMADLSEYAGKTIQVSFTAVSKNTMYTFIDNVKIGNILSHDLTIYDINAPSSVVSGNDFNIEVTVANEGTAAAENYTVELYADDELISTIAGKALGAGENATVTFDVSMSPLAKEMVTYTAKVVYDADQNTANNSSKSALVIVTVSKLPEATDLTAAADKSAVKLTWNEPDLAAIPADAVTEDFEDGIAFASRYGEWTFVDLDQSPVDGFSNIDVPNIVNGVTKGSFWIWDTTSVGNSTFAAHSGSKYLFSLYRADEGMSNEWAVSPELNGSAQTISFWVKSYSASYPEKINVAYSTGSTDPLDFIVVATLNPVPGWWTLVEIDIPAGAKRFAINSCATGGFMLMVDDVTFIPAGAAVTNEFKGYDVYRDGEKINESLLTARDFTDNNVVEGKTYSYAVVAVYSKGVAGPSNAVTVVYDPSGIESVYAGTLTISTARNSIIVTGADGQHVAVYAVDGKTVFAGEGEAKTVIPAQPGVYVVKAGATVKKVLVK